MQLRAEQLRHSIEQKGLSPVYLISGDEPLQLNEAADFIRYTARQQGVEERVVLDVSSGFDWNQLLDESTSMSLFASTRLIELKLGSSKPGREGGKILTEYAEQCASENILLITSDKLDKRVQQSKWYKSLDKVGVTMQVWPIDNDRLPSWIQQRVRSYKQTISLEAAQLVADRVEGNMLAASQEIDKLCLLVEHDDISVDDVLAAVTDSTRYDVFELIECAYASKTERLLRILRGLKNEGMEPMAIYGALMWDYRRLCSMAYHFHQGVALEKLFSEYRIWDNKRKQAIRNILNKHELIQMNKMLKQADNLDKTIKSSERHTVWDALQLLLLSFAGVQLPLHQFK